MPEVAVRIEHLTFRRGARKIFDDITLDIEAGKITAVMGPSGSGKTTLMRLITGQLRPDSGKVIVLGKEVEKLSRRALMQLRREMSMLFQTNALFTDMTLGDNVAFPLREVSSIDESLIQILVQMKLQAVGLRGAESLMPSELSGGMARRAALARAIAMDPRIMIYDEPFTGQDPITLGMLTRLVRDLNDGLGMTSLVVSHDIAEVTAISDRIILISGGKVVAYDSPENLQRSDDPMVAQFMHGKADGPVPFHYPTPISYQEAMRGAHD